MKIKLFFIGVAVIVATLLIYSCKKSSIQDEITNNTEIVLFKRADNQPLVNSGVIGSNSKMVSRIELHNSILTSLKSSDEWKGILNNYAIDEKNITRSSFTNSSVELINIPLLSKSNNEKTILNIYVKGEKFIISKMIISTLENGNQRFSIQKMDGELYYQVEVNSENKVGNWKFGSSIPFKEVFVNKIKDNSVSNVIQKTQSLEASADCSTMAWKQCMQCIIVNVCSNDWVCVVACGALLYSCVGGAAAFCALA